MRVIREISKGPYVWCAVCGKQAGPAMTTYILQFLGVEITLHLNCMDDVIGAVKATVVESR